MYSNYQDKYLTHRSEYLRIKRMINKNGGGQESNIKSKGYAATDESGQLIPWEFERRPVGDHDVLIDIKYASICHSDIHQEMGHWGKEKYPQVPGHEMTGIVKEIGKHVTKFQVGDRVGVGPMVDSCLTCDHCKKDGEQYCDEIVFAYGSEQESSPTGITQGGYSINIVVRDHFVLRIPDNLKLEEAAPLLCAGITSYSPLITANVKPGDKVGISGIGGLGHLAVKLAVSKGAEVYAFTTSPSKVDDIKSFGAREVIVVDDDHNNLKPYAKTLDYMVSTLPYEFDIGPYMNCVKPHGTFTYVGMPIDFKMSINMFEMAKNRVKLNSSLVGSIEHTQELIDYCAENNIKPDIQMINANEVNRAWQNVIDKKVRYRYVIDASTF